MKPKIDKKTALNRVGETFYYVALGLLSGWIHRTYKVSLNPSKLRRVESTFF